MAPSATQSSIPFAYRLLLTTIEPVLALNGAVMALSAPESYLALMTRGAVPFRGATAFLYTQTAGAWLYFAFVEAVVLRLYATDLRLWRLLCAGMLLSDAAVVHATAQAVGGWASWLRVGEWEAGDWAMQATFLPILFVRVLILLGVGVRTPAKVKG